MTVTVLFPATGSHWAGTMCVLIFTFPLPLFCLLPLRPVLFHTFLSCPILSFGLSFAIWCCLVMQCSIFGCRVLHCSVWSCCVSSRYIHSCPLWGDFPTFCPRPSPPVLSCIVLPYPFLLGQPSAFGPVLASPILSCPALYYVILYRLVLYFLDYPGPSFSVWSCTIQYRQGLS